MWSGDGGRSRSRRRGRDGRACRTRCAAFQAAIIIAIETPTARAITRLLSLLLLLLRGRSCPTEPVRSCRRRHPLLQSRCLLLGLLGRLLLTTSAPGRCEGFEGGGQLVAQRRRHAQARRTARSMYCAIVRVQRLESRGERHGHRRHRGPVLRGGRGRRRRRGLLLEPLVRRRRSVNGIVVAAARG